MKSFLTAMLTLAAMTVLACGGSQQQFGGVNLKTSMSALHSDPRVSSVFVELRGLDNGWPGVSGPIRNESTDGTGDWSAQFDKIPVGKISLYARAVDAAGSILFETVEPRLVLQIKAHEIVDVTLVLQQKTDVPQFDNHAPFITSLVASENEIDGATTLELAAAFGDEDGDVESIQWSGAGTFSAPTAAETLWTPPAVEGETTIPLTFTVTDKKGQKAIFQLSIKIAAKYGKGGVKMEMDLNNFPRVGSVLVSNNGVVNSTVLPYDTIILAAVASDADSDALDYSWAEVNHCGGAFVGGNAGATVSYRVGPAAQCAFVVTVTDFYQTDTSKPRGGTNTGTLEILVANPVVGVGPQFYVSALTPVVMALGQWAEAQIIPADLGSHLADSAEPWELTWSDGGAGGTFSYLSPIHAPNDGAVYTPPAACPAAFAGQNMPLTLTITAKNLNTRAENSASLGLELVCP